MKNIKRIFTFVLLVFSTILTSCSNFKYIDKPDYILEDKYEIYEGVKYYYSSSGLVAKEIIESNEEITIFPMVNNEPVYSVATYLLKDNSDIKVLNLPIAPLVYERNCISNCVNLNTINLIDLIYTHQNTGIFFEKNAFNLEKDCYIYIHNAKSIEKCVYDFKPYVNRFKLLNPIEVRFSLHSYIKGSGDYDAKEKNLSFSIKGKLFGIIDVDASQSYSLGDPWSCERTVKLIDDVDFFINNYKKIKNQEFEISINAYILAKKNIIQGIVSKDYPLSYSKKEKRDQLLYTFTSNSSNSNPGIGVSFTTTFSYYENK